LDILCEPAVAAHWAAEDDDDEQAAFLSGEGAEDDEAFTTFAVTLGDDEVIGWICGWEKLDPEYRHAGIDLFLASAHHGKGYGPEAVRIVCRWLFHGRGHHRITIDPAADNEAAIRAYEKVGFRRVGTL